MAATLRQIVTAAVAFKEAADLVAELQTRKQTAITRESQAHDSTVAAAAELNNQLTIAQQLRDQLKSLLNEA